jgi:hypothetical protein
MMQVIFAAFRVSDLALFIYLRFPPCVRHFALSMPWLFISSQCGMIRGQLLEKLSGMSVKWINFDSLPARHESYRQVKFL